MLKRQSAAQRTWQVRVAGMATALILLVLSGQAQSRLIDFYTVKPNLLNAKEKITLVAKGSKQAFIFISHTCPCSRSHLKHLSELAANNKEITFHFIESEPVSKADEALIIDFYNQNSFKSAVISDSDQELVKAFKALRTPQAFLVDAEGEIKFTGGITNSAHFDSANKFPFKNALEQFKNGEPLNPDTYKFLGCYIERKQ